MLQPTKAAAFLIVLLTVACSAKVPLAPQSRDAEAKSFSTLSDKSKIYVVRTCAYGQRLHEVSVDGSDRIYLACQTYTVYVVQPGDHTIAVASTENRELMNLKTSSGKNYFVEMGSRMGSGTGDLRATVKLLDELEGITAIENSRLVSSEGY